MKTMLWICKTTFICIAISAFEANAIANAEKESDCENNGENCKKQTENDRFSRSFDLPFSNVDQKQLAKASRRYKRSFNIPNPSKLDLEIKWTIPVESVKGLTSMVFETDISFDLTTLNTWKTTTTTTAAPMTTTKPPSSYSSYATKRVETDPAEISRLDFYKHMESFLDRRGYDGKECTLRTLCEFAEAPFDHGIYGELINMIMSASLNPKKVGGYDKYMTAEYYGKHYGECEKIYPKCPQSVLDIFSASY